MAGSQGDTRGSFKPVVISTGEQVWMLGECTSHRDTACRAAKDEDLVPGGDTAGNQVFRAGDQITPAVRLVGILSPQSPCLAQFATTTHMARRIGAPGLQETCGPEAETAAGESPGRLVS